uniref:UDENN domain-containing protein n=1 Tax=Leptobrachium leishanense TaxID=445787 RepID=A0A8C5Q775_9ANUR
MGSRVKQNPETTFEVYVEVTRPAASNEDLQLWVQFLREAINGVMQTSRGLLGIMPYLGEKNGCSLPAQLSSGDPELQRIFPEDFSDQDLLQTVTKFCFPFCLDSLSASQVGQNFTFVLTDIDSKQRFGFCRLSSGAKSCFCILRNYTENHTKNASQLRQKLR